MSSNTFFTSDTHFFHDNVIKYCNRPFANAREMNEALCENWCKVVTPYDTIYHIGDVSFGKKEQTENLLHTLPGRKILVAGNHDNLQILRPFFTNISLEYRGKLLDQPNSPHFHMYHYPLRDWDRRYHGSIHLHGHVHSNTPSPYNEPNSFDVGVDANNYTPVSLDYILENKYDKDRLNEYFEQQGSNKSKHSKNNSTTKE